MRPALLALPHPELAACRAALPGEASPVWEFEYRRSVFGCRVPLVPLQLTQCLGQPRQPDKTPFHLFARPSRRYNLLAQTPARPPACLPACRPARTRDKKEPLICSAGNNKGSRHAKRATRFFVSRGNNCFGDKFASCPSVGVVRSTPAPRIYFVLFSFSPWLPL